MIPPRSLIVTTIGMVVKPVQLGVVSYACDYRRCDEYDEYDQSTRTLICDSCVEPCPSFSGTGSETRSRAVKGSELLHAFGFRYEEVDRLLSGFVRNAHPGATGAECVAAHRQGTAVSDADAGGLESAEHRSSSWT